MVLGLVLKHVPHPVALLEEQAASRVPELVPLRYGRMLVSRDYQPMADAVDSARLEAQTGM